MTPIGYLRKVEAFAIYLRDTLVKDEEVLDTLVNAIDQAWQEMTHEDHLLAYNIVQFVHQNIKPAKAAEPEKPRIQLIN